MASAAVHRPAQYRKAASVVVVDNLYHLPESIPNASGRVFFRAWETKPWGTLIRRWRTYVGAGVYTGLILNIGQSSASPSLPHFIICMARFSSRREITRASVLILAQPLQTFPSTPPGSPTPVFDLAIFRHILLVVSKIECEQSRTIGKLFFRCLLN
jgi:hypothetical protein